MTASPSSGAPTIRSGDGEALHRRSLLGPLAVSVVASGAILTAFVAAMLTMAGSAPSLPQLGVIFAGAMIVVLAGEHWLAWASDAVWPARLALVWIAGLVATMAAQLLGYFVFGLDAPHAFAIWALILFALTIVRPPRSAARAGRLSDFPDWVVLAAIAIIAGFACRNIVAALPSIVDTGRLVGFSDDILHAAHIAEFGDPLAYGRGYLMLSDIGLSFYHYGHYMPVAAVMALLGLPPLAATSALLVPLGVLIAGVGIYALAGALGGRAAGLLALGVIFALPDGSQYGPGMGFFGFHGVLIAAPGSGFGLAAACGALVCLDRFWRHGEGRRMLATAAALTAAITQLRFHFILLMMPALALTAFAALPAVRRRPWQALVLFATAVAGLVLLCLFVPPVRDRIAAFTNVVRFLTVALDYLGPSFHPDFFANLVASLGTRWAVAVGVAVALLEIVGVLIVVYPLLLFWKVRRFGWELADIFPLALTLSYIAVMVLAPSTPFAEPSTELQHRPLIFFYAIMAIYASAYLCRIVGLGRDQVLTTRTVAVAATALIILSGLFAVFVGYGDRGKQNAMAASYSRVPIDPGVVPIALAIREAARPGQTLAVATLEPSEMIIELCAEIASISAVPCYVSRPSEAWRVAGANGATVEARLATMRDVAASPTLPAAYAKLRAAGVDWYVVRASAPLAFDPQFSGAMLRNSAGALYEVP
ncbi:hypothetical protein C3941_03925 [Kaistia algarum]|uniref:hypothetical protein n=1 Tax=Kaistia algarum TaxID=2083279 RepID=UPI000CE747CD|nr:hypothetical protein [Kaistia algarum]MCX5512637.1 hypothetical protein [Kaistia algarum]PPE81847.1 hypothetical protein C3941_03925 [Kaistia algarum]